MEPANRPDAACATSLFPLRRVRVLWHPDSPGMRVPVRTLFFRRRSFATLGETIRYYRAAELVEALRGR